MKINFCCLFGLLFFNNLSTVSKYTSHPIDKREITRIIRTLALWYNDRQEKNRLKAIKSLKDLTKYKDLEKNFKSLRPSQRSVLIRCLPYLNTSCNHQEKKTIEHPLQQFSKFYKNLDQNEEFNNSLMERNLKRDVEIVLKNK